MSDETNPIQCSFCYKTTRTVSKMFHGPTCVICSDCVEICASGLRAAGMAPAKIAPPPARANGATIWNQAYFKVKPPLTRDIMKWWPDFRHLIITAIDAALAASAAPEPGEKEPP